MPLDVLGTASERVLPTWTNGSRRDLSPGEMLWLQRHFDEYDETIFPYLAFTLRHDMKGGN
jgi:hypothetical protein